MIRQNIFILNQTIGVEAPRTRSVIGGMLPSARDVSNAVHQETVTSVNSQLTPYVTTFGQFLDHDFTSTPLMQGKQRIALHCNFILLIIWRLYHRFTCNIDAIRL